MVDRIDRRRPSAKISSKGGVKTASAGPVSRSSGGLHGGVDRFGGIGRLIGGPSDLISSPGTRITMPLTREECIGIDKDPLIAEARKRIEAYRNLPEKWKKEVDKWGRSASVEMAYAIMRNQKHS